MAIGKVKWRQWNNDIKSSKPKFAQLKKKRDQDFVTRRSEGWKAITPFMIRLSMKYKPPKVYIHHTLMEALTEWHRRRVGSGSRDSKVVLEVLSERGILGRCLWCYWKFKDELMKTWTWRYDPINTHVKFLGSGDSQVLDSSSLYRSTVEVDGFLSISSFYLEYDW